MSKIEVNTVAPQCGTTLTLGESGDTVTLGSGASQSGFGRTGTVDWDTTAKTGDFTAVSGNGYFVNTTSGTITVTLPASPSAGNIIAVKDYTGTFDINDCTVARNGSNIRGATNDFTLEKANSGAVFIYVDGTEGWQVFVDGSDSDASNTFIVATGGTITTSGDFKIHTFTGPGTFTVNCVSCSAANNEVSYMVVAGGGGSGRSYGAGAGAGGFRERKSGIDTYTASPLNGSTPITVAATSFPITVGGGGAKATPSGPANPATDGSNSVFSTITSQGGGGAGHYSNSSPAPQRGGRPGGSGGGGADGAPEIGSGNIPPVSPAQGTNGGTGGPGAAGGGGGATVAGTGSPSNGVGGVGGAGATTHITGSPVAYAGGGGGFGSGTVGPGGTGGGGAGGNPGVAGTVNTGGGGGGTGSTPNCDMTNTGGSGIVIIRYKFQ